ncbi:MAG: methyltransferase, partial [Alphaproteobacteria bacterium]|nr:methyltransferase [Alphaproteobacteria bacterium]
IGLASSYLDEIHGNIADLFCGVGTFSYALANDNERQITAVDSSVELLSGFQESLNRQMITNIKIENRNLFKYPLTGKELCGYQAILFDPPRAGAKEQVAEISRLNNEDKPQKIVAISCNPHSFVRDANILIQGGYQLMKVTMVDQFVYSNHSELVALFALAI